VAGAYALLLFGESSGMTVIGDGRVREGKPLAGSQLQRCREFSILYVELRKSMKTGSLDVDVSTIKSILCGKAFGFNTEIF